jgi:cytochrome c-type biogenesis protein CcmH/NrfF
VLIFAVPAVLVVLGALLAGRLAARRQTANED